MDLNLIKKKLDNLNQSKKSTGGGKNLFWKPSVGKQVVRVVPNKYNKSIPFTEMFFYYGIGERVMASPQNWKEKDPIREFTKQFRTSNDKENWRLAKKLDAKTRIFAPIIVRGEESEGVKLWQFGKEVYQEFLNMAADEEIGDYTDIAQGRDIKLTTVGPETTGTPYNKLEDRVYALESLKAIDKVYVFDNKDHLEWLVQITKPDILVVGSDWKGKEIVGGQHAKKIVYFDRIGDYSTTDILKYDRT